VGGKIGCTKHFPILVKLPAEVSMSAIQIFRLARAGGWMEEMQILGITDGFAIVGMGVELSRYPESIRTRRL
jgi:hypothetical protein